MKTVEMLFAVISVRGFCQSWLIDTNMAKNTGVRFFLLVVVDSQRSYALFERDQIAFGVSRL